jgi:hypothetical protein
MLGQRAGGADTILPMVVVEYVPPLHNCLRIETPYRQSERIRGWEEGGTRRGSSPLVAAGSSSRWRLTASAIYLRLQQSRASPAPWIVFSYRLPLLHLSFTSDTYSPCVCVRLLCRVSPNHGVEPRLDWWCRPKCVPPLLLGRANPTTLFPPRSERLSRQKMGCLPSHTHTHTRPQAFDTTKSWPTQVVTLYSFLLTQQVCGKLAVNVVALSKGLLRQAIVCQDAFKPVRNGK